VVSNIVHAQIGGRVPVSGGAARGLKFDTRWRRGGRGCWRFRQAESGMRRGRRGLASAALAGDGVVATEY
jgi:hypothetical protein